MSSKANKIKLNCVTKCIELPIVQSVWNRMNNVYKSVKAKNKLLNFSLDVVEFNLKLVVEEIIPRVPFVDQLQRPLVLVDGVICGAVDNLICPLLRKKTVKVLVAFTYYAYQYCLFCKYVMIKTIQAIYQLMSAILYYVTMRISEYLFYVPRVLLQIIGKTTCERCHRQLGFADKVYNDDSSDESYDSADENFRRYMTDFNEEMEDRDLQRERERQQMYVHVSSSDTSYNSIQSHISENEELESSSAYSSEKSNGSNDNDQFEVPDADEHCRE